MKKTWDALEVTEIEIRRVGFIVCLRHGWPVIGCSQEMVEEEIHLYSTACAGK